MSENYVVTLYSNNGSYHHFPGITHDWFRDDTIKYENGIVELEDCAGVRYDTQVTKDGEPVGAVSTEDECYFFKTMVVLRYLRGAYG